jgi:hypothetical protein
MCRKLASTVLAIPLLLAGCATNNVGVKVGEPVAFIVAPTTDLPPVEFSNEAINQDAGYGAAGGALAGAPFALACGPFAVFCIGPAMLIGAGAGAVVGSAVGVIDGVPQDVRQQLQQRADRYVRSHDVRSDLVSARGAQGSGLWIVAEPSPATAAVRVMVEKVYFYGMRDGRIGIVMDAKIVVRPAGGSRKDEEENSFRYVGPASGSAQWLAKTDEMVEANFRAASDGAAS